MAKPVLILQLRPEDAAADNELKAFLKFGEIEEYLRIRIDKSFVPSINLDDYSAVIVGGGPYNISDPDNKKGDNQLNFEKHLLELLDKVSLRDFPYLGMCYGMGILAKYLGGEISKKQYSEDVGAVDIEITDDGKYDQLTKNLPKTFKAFAGHKEACQNLPKDALNLAKSKTCPFQIIRHKNNIYGTQFHTELDQAGIELRINIYRHAGYFPPEDAEMLIAQTKKYNVTFPEKILKKFIATYAIK